MKKRLLHIFILIGFLASAFFVPKSVFALSVILDNYREGCRDVAQPDLAVCMENADSCQSEMDSLLFCLETGLDGEEGVTCSATGVCDEFRSDYVYSNIIDDSQNYKDCLADGRYTYDAENGTYTLTAAPRTSGLTIISECAQEADLSLREIIGGSTSPGQGSDINDELENSNYTYGAESNQDALMQLCEGVSNPTAKSQCLSCAGPPNYGVWTAIGCMSTNISGFTQTLVSFLIGVAGLFFLAQILYSAARLITSTGNPQAVTQAREAILSSVIAIIFIVLSVFILRLFGIHIFDLPGFFGGT